jgi:osmotically-inducible protein OsmY
MSPIKRIGGPWIGASLLIGLLPAALAACSPVGMAIGAGATVTNMAMEERGFINSTRDKAIWTDINARMLNKNHTLLQNVDVQVHEGRVLLTGFVQKPEDRVEATRIAWEPDGVREVVDEIKLGRSLDAGDFSEDVLLIQQIRLKLMFDRDIRAINYSVDCIRSTVYLMGVARTPGELQRVIDHVRDVPYVRAVVNHVRVRTDPLPPIPANPPVIADSGTVPATAATAPLRPAKPSQRPTQ